MQSDILDKKEQLFDAPEEQLANWFELAKSSGLSKPDAFSLASVSASGQPRCRVVLHKGFVEGCISFYTNYQSEKAKELAANPNVSATFYWDLPMDVQVRVEGKVEKLSAELSDQYFNSRPRGSKIGAWASPQSEKIQSREQLVGLVEEVEKRFEGIEDVPRPDFWGGYLIRPTKYDFMLMRKDRLHDRYEFALVDGKWVKSRIAP